MAAAATASAAIGGSFFSAPPPSPYIVPLSPSKSSSGSDEKVACILADGSSVPVTRADFTLMYDFHDAFEGALPDVFDTRLFFLDCAQRPLVSEPVLEYVPFVLSQRRSPSLVPHPIIAPLSIAMDTVIVAQKCGADPQLLHMAVDCFAIVDDQWELPDANRCATFLEVSTVAPGICFAYGGPQLHDVMMTALDGWPSLTLEGQISVRCALSEQLWPLYAMLGFVDYFTAMPDLFVQLQAELVTALRRMPMRELSKLLTHILKEQQVVTTMQHTVNLACKSRLTPIEWRAVLARSAIAADRVDMMGFTSSAPLPASEMFFIAAADGASMFLEALTGGYNLTESQLPTAAINAGLVHYVAQPGVSPLVEHVMVCMRVTPESMLDVGRMLQVHGCNNPAVQEIVRLAVLHNRVCGTVPKEVVVACIDPAFKQTIMQLLKR